MPGTLPASPDTPNISLTAGLANRFPRQAEEEAQGITGANTIQMQRLAGGVASGTSAPPTSSTVSDAGAKLATSAAQQGAQAGAGAGQLLSGAEQVRQQGLGVQQQNAQAQTATSLATKQQQNADRLAALSAGVANNLVTQNMKFQSDQIGAGTLNATQLADWTVQNAKDQQQVQDNMQDIQMATQRKLQLYQAAYQKLTATLEDQQQLKDLAAKGITQQDIQQFAQEAKMNYMQAQAAAAAQSAMITGAFTIVGAAIGSAAGPAGTAGGAMVGQAAGSAVAGAAAPQ